MHLLATGGTGFFGKALLRYWKKSGILCHGSGMRVTLLSRNPLAFQENYGHLLTGLNVSLHQGDILNPSSLPNDPSITHVLHAATDSTLGPKLTPLARYDQIVIGTRHMLDFAVQHRVQRLLLTSSGGVYGAQPTDMDQIPEDYLGIPDPTLPANAYSVGKRAAEHLCALYSDSFGLDTVVARCFAFVGPDLPLNVHFAIGNFIRDALYGEEIVVGGDGTPVRSYLFQEDLADWLMVMLQQGRSGRVYNLGSDEAISIAELAYLVRDLVAPGKPVRIMNQPDPMHKKNRYVPSVARARSELGLSVQVGLERAIKETVKDIKVQV